MIQKRGLGQPRNGCEETGKKAARKWRGSEEEGGVHHANCCSPWPLLGKTMCLCLPDCPPLFCSGPEGKVVSWLRLCLTHSNLVCIQASKREGRSPPGTGASDLGAPPMMACCVLSHTFYVTWVPRTHWGASLWLEGVSSNHYSLCRGSPWFLGKEANSQHEMPVWGRWLSQWTTPLFWGWTESLHNFWVQFTF